MRALLAALVLLPAAARAGDRFFFGPLVQLQAAGRPAGAGLGVGAEVDDGAWKLGIDARVGVPRIPSVMLGLNGRVDRYLVDGLYLGGSLGYLDELDGEFYGGEGPAVGGQLGYVFGRGRAWGRVALEAGFTTPLFRERPGKPGNYTFSFFTLGARLLL